MKTKSYLDRLFLNLMAFFAVGRVAFVCYNHQLGQLSLYGLLGAFLKGLWMDVAVVGIFLFIPSLFTLLAHKFENFPLRWILVPYYIIIGICAGTIVAADMIMYEFWQFKLGAVILSYAASPEGATNSVSIWFLISRLLLCLTMMLLVIVPCICLTPRKVKKCAIYYSLTTLISLLLSLHGLFLMEVGDAYSSSRNLFCNHVAVNPVFAFAKSFEGHKHPATRYHYLSETERTQVFADLYPQETEDVADTLLTTSRPDILIVFMESFGGKFVKELGGLPDVAPNLGRLIPEGIFWENYYSSSFRTDRGTVSLLSGTVSYPDISSMRDTAMHVSLPSLARSLKKIGYRTNYLYAGVMTNMGKRTYLEDMDFEKLLDYTAFSEKEMTSSWGADDEVAAQKAFHLVAECDSTQPQFFVWQTLSSHEPWVVPYHRLEDEKLNAFAFTDQCVGDLVDSLKTLPRWDNLLVIILPDHGFLYEQNYEDPEFFHSPMLWLGGAIREPRRMQVLMNQSDVAATLLSQLGVSHNEYYWSRNVLSTNYTHPFVYCNFPAGIMLKDETGVSIFDITANRPILSLSGIEDERILKAKSILQTSYKQLAR